MIKLKYTIDNISIILLINFRNDKIYITFTSIFIMWKRSFYILLTISTSIKVNLTRSYLHNYEKLKLYVMLFNLAEFDRKMLNNTIILEFMKEEKTIY